MTDTPATVQPSTQAFGQEFRQALEAHFAKPPAADAGENTARFIELCLLVNEFQPGEGKVYLFQGTRKVAEYLVADFDQQTAMRGTYTARLYCFDPRSGRKGFIAGATVQCDGDGPAPAHAAPEPAPAPVTAPAPAPTPIIVQPAPVTAPPAPKMEVFMEKFMEAAIANMANSKPQTIEDQLKVADALAARFKGTTPPDAADKYAWIEGAVKAAVPILNRIVDSYDKRTQAVSSFKRVENTAQQQTSKDAGNGGTSGGEQTPPPDAAAEPESKSAKTFRECRVMAADFGAHASLGDVVAVLILGHEEKARDGVIASRVVLMLEDDWNAEDFPSEADRKGVAATVERVHGLIGNNGDAAGLSAATGVPVERIEAIARIACAMLPRVEAKTHEESEANRAQLDSGGTHVGAGGGGVQSPGGNGTVGGPGGAGGSNAGPGAGGATPQAAAARRRGRNNAAAATTRTPGSV